ncbi:MAG TPA: type IV pilin protein [Rhodanobacter sp.]
MTSNAVFAEKTMTRQRGFTLVELMIVVVIIAILAAIAIPAFGRYAYRAHRVDGQELLLRIANAQERYYATNNHYGSLANIGFTAPVNSEKGYYTAASAPAAPTTSQIYVATATPVGAQNKDLCGPLTINNAGVKTPGPASAASNSNGSCW